MYEGQPFRLSMFLPHWMSADDLFVMGAGLAAGLAVFAVGSSFMERDRLRPRIRALQERRSELQGGLTSARRRKHGMVDEGSVNFMRRVVNRFQLLKGKQAAAMRGRLVEAGFRSKDAIVVYLFCTLVSPVIFGALGVLLMQMNIWGEGKLAKFHIVAPILMLYVGLKFPAYIVNRARKKRYAAVQKALADTLDLMTICAEAGLSLNMALERVSRELGIAYPEMAEELALTAMELGFLPERNKALLNLAERVQIPEVRGITSVLIQTEKYGTPIAQAMRVLSAEFREQRMLRAENKAARLPAIMTIPMICFILPTLFIIIIAPAAIMVSDNFK